MRPCPTCGEYLMNDGLSFNEGVSAALIGGDRKRTHKCLPKWEFLVGECAKAGVWDEAAIHETYDGTFWGAAKKIIKDWNESDGEYPMGPDRNGNSQEIMLLGRRAEQPEIVFACEATAEMEIAYYIRNERQQREPTDDSVS